MLFASGALTDTRRSLGLVQAGVLGYMIAITLLVVVFGPALASYPGLKLVLQAACAGNLILSARGMWGRKALDANVMSWRAMFSITLLSPKAFTFAFTLIPADPLSGYAAKLPWIALLLLLIGGAELAWIGLGKAVSRGLFGPISIPFCWRVGAVAITGFAAVLTYSIVASGLALAGLHH